MKRKTLSQFGLLTLGVVIAGSVYAADPENWNAEGGEKDLAMTLTPEGNVSYLAGVDVSLGLIDAGDGWLRDRFTEIGVIEYEHYEDTSEEYVNFDLVDGADAPLGAVG